MRQRLCVLDRALGRQHECPLAGCPFWEDGGALLEPGCMLERFLPADEWTPELARRWLGARDAFLRAGDAHAGARATFHRLSGSMNGRRPIPA